MSNLSLNGGIDCGTFPALLRDIFMVTDTFGWVVGDDGAYAFTDDGGTTWTPLFITWPDLLVNKYFNCGEDPNDIYQIHFFEDSGAGFDPYDKGSSRPSTDGSSRRRTPARRGSRS